MARRKDESLINNRKQKKARKVMFAVAFLLTLLCIGTGSYVQELDTVQVGSVAEKRYVAEADAVDEVATNKLKDAAADSVAPIYKQDAAVEEGSNAEVKELFQDLEQILANLKQDESFVEKAQEAPWKLPVVLSERELKAYQALGKSNRTLFQEDCLVTMNNLYTEGITADALEEGRQKANEAFAATAWNKGLKEMAGAIFDAAITPNLLPDEAAIEAAREEKRAEVADVMIRKNQKIVDEGEIITQEIYDRLVSLHLVGGADYKSSVLPLLGSFLLVVLLFVALYLFFVWGRGQFELKPNEAKMLFTIYVIMILLLRLMGGDAEIVALGVPYARIFLMFTPFFMCNYIVSAFVRNDGDPSLAMVATLSGSLFNVVFDYIFMFPLGLGLAGAALATAVSPIISIAICSRHFLKKENTLQFVRQLPSARLLAQSCQLGISGFVGELSSGVTTTVFNFLLLGLAGNVGVAAYGVVANFALVATAIFNGVAQGAQPLVSRCYGQNDHAGARKLLLLGSGTVLVLAAVLYAAVFGLTDTFVSWFNSENSVQMAQYAHTGMRMYFVGYFFAGFNIMAAGYLSAVNRPAEASITSICRGMVAIVACSLLLSAVFGMPGVWAAFPASELLTALLTLFLLRRKKAETA